MSRTVLLGINRAVVRCAKRWSRATGQAASDREDLVDRIAR